MSIHRNDFSDPPIPIIILVSIFWIVVIAFFFYELTASKNYQPGYKICGAGLGNCIDTRKYTEINGCTIAETGDKVCGQYTISKEEY